MVPNGSKWSPPIPIPGVRKSLLPGGKLIRTKVLLGIFYGFYFKNDLLLNYSKTNTNHKKKKEQSPSSSVVRRRPSSAVVRRPSSVVRRLPSSSVVVATDFFLVV